MTNTPPANALVLRADQGGSIVASPMSNGRMAVAVTSISHAGVPITLDYTLDRGTTEILRDFLSAWLEQEAGE